MFSPVWTLLWIISLNILSINSSYVWPKRADKLSFGIGEGNGIKTWTSSASEVDTCEVPGDYELKGSSWYFFDVNVVDFYASKKLCEDSGAHLAYFTTEQEYLTIMEYTAAFGNVWTGLEKSSADFKCNGAASVCLAHRKLLWSDGSDFRGGEFIEHGINIRVADGMTTCTLATGVAQNLAGAVADPTYGNLNGCSRIVAKTLCQFNCP